MFTHQTSHILLGNNESIFDINYVTRQEHIKCLAVCNLVEIEMNREGKMKKENWLCRSQGNYIGRMPSSLSQFRQQKIMPIATKKSKNILSIYAPYESAQFLLGFYSSLLWHSTYYFGYIFLY
jgi:hypothetical protein